MAASQPHATNQPRLSQHPEVSRERRLRNRLVAARTWLLEFTECRIRVNILSPVTVDTPILDPLREEAKEFFKSQILRGEMGRSEEIVTVAPILASSDSSFVNGIELFVDDGTAQV